VSSLSVCLLLDETADRAVRRLWRQLEDDGVPTLASATHGRHLPHLTLVDVGVATMDDVRAALDAVPPAEPLPVTFVALGAFTRSRCSLVPTVPRQLVAHQLTTAAAIASAGLQVGRHYRADAWLPHLTLGPRLPLSSLTTVAGRVFEVLPLTATLERMAIVDTSAGDVYPL
jgi:2'-5' RNA ligase